MANSYNFKFIFIVLVFCCRTKLFVTTKTYTNLNNLNKTKYKTFYDQNLNYTRIKLINISIPQNFENPTNFHKTFFQNFDPSGLQSDPVSKLLVFLHQILTKYIPEYETLTIIYNPVPNVTPNFDPDFLIKNLSKIRQIRSCPYKRQCVYNHLFSKYIDNDLGSFRLQNWTHDNILVVADTKTLGDVVSSHYMNMNEVFGKIFVFVLDDIPYEFKPG